MTKTARPCCTAEAASIATVSAQWPLPRSMFGSTSTSGSIPSIEVDRSNLVAPLGIRWLPLWWRAPQTQRRYPRIVRILIVVPSLGVGGCERYVASVAFHIAQSAEVTVAHQSVIDSTMGTLLDPLPRALFDVVTGSRDPISRFRKLFTNLAPDKVVVVLPMPIAEPGGPEPLDLLEAAAAIAPTTVVFQLAHLEELLPVAARNRAHHLLNSYDQKWVAVSKQNRRALATTFDIPIDAITWIPNGTKVLHIAAAKRPHDRPVLLQIGRLVRWKAQEDSIRALSLLQHESVLWLAGEGYDRERLSNLARELSVENQVRFLGQCEDVDGLIASADIVLHPTIAEGASFALLEAMAAAKPIVASDAASNPDLVRDGLEGWIHPVHSPQVQAALIDQVLDDGSEARKRGKAARARVASEFTVERMLGELDAIIHRAVKT